MKLILITGINKGLGKALFDYLITKNDYIIVGISRRITQKQQELHKENKFTYIPMDLLNLKNPEKELNISKLLHEAEEVTYVNNAATINPINKIGSFEDEQILQLMYLNSSVPLLITNYLFKEISDKKINILNISSGAAKSPIVGWSLYCASKAANEMFFKVLGEQEKGNPNIRVLSIDPGVIDSGMQEIIRTTDNKIFPKVEDFIKLKENNKLQTCEEAAMKIINQILLGS